MEYVLVLIGIGLLIFAFSDRLGLSLSRRSDPEKGSPGSALGYWPGTTDEAGSRDIEAGSDSGVGDSGGGGVDAGGGGGD